MIGDQTGAAIIGAANTAVGSAFGAHWAKESQKRAQKFAIHMAKHRHQYETQDLEEAGLNRILSITQGGPMAAVGAHSTPMGPDIAGGAAKSMMAMTAAKEAMARIRNLNRNTAKQGEEERRARHEADILQETKRYVMERSAAERDSAKAIANFDQDKAKLIKFTIPAAESSARAQMDPMGKESRFWGTMLDNIFGGSKASSVLRSLK